MKRMVYLGVAGLLIVAGLSLRLVPWGLPLWLHHFGGGFLWGAMLYALVMALRPPGFGRGTALATAAAAAMLIETLRLYHTPALDTFRMTLPGQLLLGSIFSAWNIVVDTLGVVIAAALTSRIPRRRP